MSSNEVNGNTHNAADELIDVGVWGPTQIQQAADEQLANQLSTLHRRLIKVCHWIMADHPDPCSTLYYQATAMLKELEGLGVRVGTICARLKVANSQPKKLNPDKEA